MTAPLRRVLVKRSDEDFAVDDPARWNYASRPDTNEARREHEALVEILRGAGAEVIDHPEPQPGRADAIFVFDPVLMTDRGAVILRMVYPPLLPVPFWKTLRDRGFRLVEVPVEEFPTMGSNVLALAPGKCLMLEGNPVTRRRLEEAGCEVFTYRGLEISLKAEGGPTCLTRPIWRSGEIQNVPTDPRSF